MYVEIRLKFLLFLHMRKNAIHKISMSCHDIGRGMASVADVIVELYEGGKIYDEMHLTAEEIAQLIICNNMPFQL